MPPPLFDSPYIFGIHEPGGEPYMLSAGRPGWIVFTEAIWHDPSDISGKDFRPWSDQGLGVICRLNNGYEPDGTIPASVDYANFARRCANYVANSPGCKIWIIGNETNLPVERPQVFGTRIAPRPSAPRLSSQQQVRSSQDRNALLRPKPIPATRSGVARAFPSLINGREVITPQMYASCYRQCRAAIRALPGHSDDQVLIAAAAPWNNETQYPGNENGDWVQYMVDILNQLGTGGLDGITLHVYSHGWDPALITADTRLDPPFSHRQFNFLAYRDFMRAIPSTMRSLPVYITETDQLDPWLDQNTGWVQLAYGEIDFWNRQTGNQQIRSLALYRWPPIDQWVIEGKQGVIEDFRTALTNEYRWIAPVTPPTPASFKVGDIVKTIGVVNLRRSPGYISKPLDDVVARTTDGQQLRILNSAPVSSNGLLWWNVRTLEPVSNQIEGWVAQTSSLGAALLEKVASAPPPPPTGIVIGGTVRFRNAVRMRLSPGYLNKPASDVIKEVKAGATATVLGGPSLADGLAWWLLRLSDGTASGWVAEKLNDSLIFLEPLDIVVPPPPPPVATFAVGDLVVAATLARVRKTAGYLNKPADDVLGEFRPRTTLNLLEGPQRVDGLTWWRVGGIRSDGNEVIGWVAQAAADGTTLLQFAPKLPGTSYPDKSGRFYLGAPFAGRFGIAQLWGENPQIYSQFTYDGVRLLGHNGIDFLTPNGTPILAVDEGTVANVVANDPTGFGNYILVRHNWGEAVYAHLQDFAVAAGQAVRRGTTLGRTDTSGFSSGPHLHFALRINPYTRTDGWGGFSDPLPYLAPGDVQLPYWVLISSTSRLFSRMVEQSPRQLLGAGYAPDKAGVKRP